MIQREQVVNVRLHEVDAETKAWLIQQWCNDLEDSTAFVAFRRQVDNLVPSHRVTIDSMILYMLNCFILGVMLLFTDTSFDNYMRTILVMILIWQLRFVSESYYYLKLTYRLLYSVDIKDEMDNGYRYHLLRGRKQSDEKANCYERFFNSAFWLIFNNPVVYIISMFQISYFYLYSIEAQNNDDYKSDVNTATYLNKLIDYSYFGSVTYVSNVDYFKLWSWYIPTFMALGAFCWLFSMTFFGCITYVRGTHLFHCTFYVFYQSYYKTYRICCIQIPITLMWKVFNYFCSVAKQQAAEKYKRMSIGTKVKDEKLFKITFKGLRVISKLVYVPILTHATAGIFDGKFGILNDMWLTLGSTVGLCMYYMLEVWVHSQTNLILFISEENTFTKVFDRAQHLMRVDVWKFACVLCKIWFVSSDKVLICALIAMNVIYFSFHSIFNLRKPSNVGAVNIYTFFGNCYLMIVAGLSFLSVFGIYDDTDQIYTFCFMVAIVELFLCGLLVAVCGCCEKNKMKKSMSS